MESQKSPKNENVKLARAENSKQVKKGNKQESHILNFINYEFDHYGAKRTKKRKTINRN